MIFKLVLLSILVMQTTRALASSEEFCKDPYKVICKEKNIADDPQCLAGSKEPSLKNLPVVEKIVWDKYEIPELFNKMKQSLAQAFQKVRGLAPHQVNYLKMLVLSNELVSATELVKQESPTIYPLSHKKTSYYRVCPKSKKKSWHFEADQEILMCPHFFQNRPESDINFELGYRFSQIIKHQNYKYIYPELEKCMSQADLKEQKYPSVASFYWAFHLFSQTNESDTDEQIIMSLRRQTSRFCSNEKVTRLLLQQPGLLKRMKCPASTQVACPFFN